MMVFDSSDSGVHGFINQRAPDYIFIVDEQ